MFTLNFNPLKTDSKYYEIFLEKYNLKIDEVVYFEHNLDAVNSARSF
jgi:FMN phosphatase YigB (HAD superfamily)